MALLRFRSTCEDASFRRPAVLSWFSLSGLSWGPVRSSHFVAPRVGPFLGRGARAHRVAPQTSNCTLGVCTRVRVAAPSPFAYRAVSSSAARLISLGKGSPVVLGPRSSQSNNVSASLGCAIGHGHGFGAGRLDAISDRKTLLAAAVRRPVSRVRRRDMLGKVRKLMEQDPDQSSGHASENEFDVRKARS